MKDIPLPYGDEEWDRENYFFNDDERGHKSIIEMSKNEIYWRAHKCRFDATYCVIWADSLTDEEFEMFKLQHKIARMGN